jgi:hypothetical protein
VRSGCRKPAGSIRDPADVAPAGRRDTHGMESTTANGLAARRVLVLANEDCAGTALFDEISRLAGDAGDVLIVAPAAVGRLDYWTDDDAGRREAAGRLEASFAACASAGIRVHGEVGDADALQALEDALVTYQPGAVLIATHHYADANWLERDVVSAAKARHPGLEIHHAVVERAAGRVLVDAEAETESGWTLLRPRAPQDHILLWGTLFLAIFGSLLWVLGGLAADVGQSALITWAIVVDLGFKALFAGIVIWRFLLRPRSDRLDL